MKLLLDENLSDRIPPILRDQFPGSSHVKDEGLAQAPDDEVWKYAKEHGFVILSKDWDFQQMSLLRGQPPKVVHLKIGNSSTQEIIELLRSADESLRQFKDDPVSSLLVLEK